MIRLALVVDETHRRLIHLYLRFAHQNPFIIILYKRAAVFRDV